MIQPNIWVTAKYSYMEQQTFAGGQSKRQQPLAGVL
uniref:Dolichol-phosphate mannosyltransferase subunit 3 n=1 Tax=Rhizophora mucronata TaxID=61149 RepID=A0A2P2JBV4_RHIMU